MTVTVGERLETDIVGVGIRVVVTATSTLAASTVTFAKFPLFIAS